MHDTLKHAKLLEDEAYIESHTCILMCVHVCLFTDIYSLVLVCPKDDIAKVNNTLTACLAGLWLISNKCLSTQPIS